MGILVTRGDSPLPQEDVLRKRTWKVGPKVLPPGFSGCRVVFWEIFVKTESMACFSFIFGMNLSLEFFLVLILYWHILHI